MLSAEVVLIRMGLAALMGGIVGLEREAVNRPAGFRTHVLVCVGSALIMIVSMSMYFSFPPGTTDPSRIAAQVVSGIGFLGAGTILREGVNIKGLTTAASLWAIAGIGLACGAGLFVPAGFGTLIIFLTLVVLKRIEFWVAIKKRYKQLTLRIADVPGQIGAIGTVLGKMRVNIKRIEFKEIESSREAMLILLVEVPPYLDMTSIVVELSDLSGVHEVEHAEG
jgi:putative Mg2+ transporter-C (MgtC) family protein